MSNLIYIHIGKVLPNGLYDSVYQSLLVSQNCKIYIILDSLLIDECKEHISKFNINLYTKNSLNIYLNINYIPLCIFDLPKEYVDLVNKLPKEHKEFRDNFWISTTSRFFYLNEFVRLFNLTNSIHIESDVMIYEDIDIIANRLTKDKLCVVKDCEFPVRVIPSIIFIPNSESLDKMCKFFIESLKVRFFNDMELIGMYSVNKHVNFFPFDFDNNKNEYIFDSCSIGQFLGGIDPRNINNSSELIKFDNPTCNFINETCTFKPNTIDIFRKNMYLNNINIPVCLFYSNTKDESKINMKKINNLHIHSKQLYQYSSVFNLKYKDIISGDRILSLCDFVITNENIYEFHKNIEKFIDIEKVIIIRDFSKVNTDILNSYFIELNKPIIKLFIYTHILNNFLIYILPYLSDKFKYDLYLHNSDHELSNEQYIKLLNTKYIKKVYSQNLNCHLDKKFTLLPIGIANSMWNHGDILSLYKTMSITYCLNKTKNLYININPNTFTYRKNILEQLESRKGAFNISNETLPFDKYLKELSTHRFCLCIRGNGLSTHREMESLYLNVIPVIVNNKYTNMNNYIRYFKELNLPFCEINDDNLDCYSDDFFNEDLYRKIIRKYNSSILNSISLKLDSYI